MWRLVRGGLILLLYLLTCPPLFTSPFSPFHLSIPSINLSLYATEPDTSNLSLDTLIPISTDISFYGSFSFQHTPIFIYTNLQDYTLYSSSEAIGYTGGLGIKLNKENFSIGVSLLLNYIFISNFGIFNFSINTLIGYDSFYITTIIEIGKNIITEFYLWKDFGIDENKKFSLGINFDTGDTKAIFFGLKFYYTKIKLNDFVVIGELSGNFVLKNILEIYLEVYDGVNFYIFGDIGDIYKVGVGISYFLI